MLLTVAAKTSTLHMRFREGGDEENSDGLGAAHSARHGARCSDNLEHDPGTCRVRAIDEPPQGHASTDSARRVWEAAFYFETLICHRGKERRGFCGSIFSPTRRSWPTRHCTWRTSSFCLSCGAKGAGKALLLLMRWLASPFDGDAAGWNGRCSTGMSKPSSSTSVWARVRGRSGS